MTIADESITERKLAPDARLCIRKSYLLFQMNIKIVGIQGNFLISLLLMSMYSQIILMHRTIKLCIIESTEPTW